MIRIRGVQARLFLAILVVGLLPAGGILAVGALGVRQLGSTTGTLGPWDAVASSGQELIEAATGAAPDDPEVAAAARAHREALSESVRRSRIWALVTDRAIALLPLAALLGTAAVALVALLAARWVSRSFSEPIRELVGWTRRIARQEPLPPGGEEEAGEAREFNLLRSALRTMDAELRAARRAEVEQARLKAWSDMARKVAHEIKNPLTPIRLAATGLARSGDATVADRGRMLLDEVSRLDALARSFSQLGRLPEGPPSEVDVVELLETLARRHAQDGVAVSVRAEDDPPLIHARYEALERVFRNLLVNAMEAMEGAPPANGAVEVTVRAVEEGVRVEVADRGPGLPPELEERIWEPDVTTKRKGTGLGLPIVRQTVESEGGRISARNREGGGAVFRVELPLE